MRLINPKIIFLALMPALLISPLHSGEAKFNAGRTERLTEKLLKRLLRGTGIQRKAPLRQYDPYSNYGNFVEKSYSEDYSAGFEKKNFSEKKPVDSKRISVFSAKNKKSEDKTFMLKDISEYNAGISFNENLNREYDAKGIVINTASGIFKPVSQYGRRYRITQVYSIGSSVYNRKVYGLIPEIHFKYTPLLSKNRPGKIDSSFSLFQVSLGLKYPYILPCRFYNRPANVFIRLNEGITRVAFEYEAKPGFQIIEYIYTLEVDFGLIYSISKKVDIGIEAGYTYIATKDVPFKGVSVKAFIGLRL